MVVVLIASWVTARSLVAAEERLARAGLASRQDLNGFLQYHIGVYGLSVVQTGRRALDGVSAAPEPKSLL